MRNITLKTAKRPTTVSRAKVRKAVQEVYSQSASESTPLSSIPEVTVVVTNRVPSKTKK